MISIHHYAYMYTSNVCFCYLFYCNFSPCYTHPMVLPYCGHKHLRTHLIVYKYVRMSYIIFIIYDGSLSLYNNIYSRKLRPLIFCSCSQLSWYVYLLILLLKVCPKSATHKRKHFLNNMTHHLFYSYITLKLSLLVMLSIQHYVAVACFKIMLIAPFFAM